MKSLYAFITEINMEEIEKAKETEGLHKGSGNCGWFKNANSLIDVLCNDKNANKLRNKYFKKCSDEEIRDIITKVYLMAGGYKEIEFDWKTAPLVLNVTGEYCKLSVRRAYPAIKEYMNEVLSMSLGRSKIELHNGFGSNAGRIYEKSMRDAIIALINQLYINIDYPGERVPWENIDTAGQYEENIRLAYSLYEQGAFDNLLSSNKTGEKIDDDVKLTGNHRARVKAVMRIEDDGTGKDVDMNGLAKEIADITIKSSKGDEYISIKEGKGQLSTVSLPKCIRDNKWFQQEIKKPIEADIEIGSKEYNIFHNFFKMFMENPEDIIRAYRKGGDDYISGEIHNIKNTYLDILARKLIGSGYWYVRSADQVFGTQRYVGKITQEVIKNRISGISIYHYHISKSGKMIKFSGKTSAGVDINFIFRTSDGSKYPFRLFIDIDLMQILTY